MAGRRSNGEGSIIYDKRRNKPYRARVTVGWTFDEKTGKTKQITNEIGSFKTKGEASRALAEYLKNPFDLANKDITFSQLYEKWFDDFVKEHASSKYMIKSAYKYCSSLYDKKIREITIIDMKTCINEGRIIETRGKYKGKVKYASPSVKFNMKYLFNHLLQYATEARLIERNYAKDFSIDSKVSLEKETNHKEKIPFSEEEVNKLWKSIEYVPFADMILYACYSGWRPSELVKLKVMDVDLEKGIIEGGIKTKAGKNRIVPIHPLVRDVVKKYYDEAISVNSDYLFNDISKKSGIGLSYDQYLSRFNKVMKTLKFSKEYTPHCTRHTFVSKANSKKVNMNRTILKLIVGHEIKDITESVYTHRSLNDLIDEMNKIKE